MSDRLFDESAPEFAREIDGAIARGEWPRGERFLAALARTVPRGRTVLDYGCGPGRLAAAIARAGWPVVGVDPSAPMIEEARRFAPMLEFSVGGEERLAGVAYAAIVCSSVIEYVPDATALLEKFRRALEPGGALVLSYANRRSLWRRWSRLRRPSAPHLRLQRHAFTPPEIAALLGRAGFRQVEPAGFFEANAFDRLPPLRRLAGSRFIGTLGLVIAWP